MNKENKNGKKALNGSLIKESLLNYNNLAQQLNENVTDSVKSLLNEQVKQAFAAILNESDDDDIKEKDYEIEEVDDTQDDSDNSDESGTQVDDQEADAEEITETGTEPEDDNKPSEESETIDGEVDLEGDIEDGADGEFEKFKVSDNKYDFRNAKDDEIVAVYKRLNNDDQVTVVKNDNQVNISDNETGAEYIIDLGTGNDQTSEITDENLTDDMNESVIYEIALNEYDSHVGYTDNYQKKDVMTSDGVKEPGNGRDIDQGVPKTTAKPWSSKKDGAPFNDKKGKTVECGGVSPDNNAPDMEETVVQKGGTNRMMGVKSHIPNTSGTDNPHKHVASVAGEYKGSKNEAIIKKANKIFEENKKLKAQLDKITEMLKEAAVTNVNLGGIIKLISENSTTKEEKREIINRFTNEVHTIEESKSLYNTISSELNKKPRSSSNINEEKQFGNTNSEIINESKFYQDESLMDSLGLMHKICK